MPPKGFITSTLVKFIIIGIFGIITTQSCYRMWKQLCVAEIQGLVWRFTDRLIQDSQEITQNIIGRDNEVDKVNHVPHCSWHMGMRGVIQSTVFILQSILTRQWWQNLFSGQIVTSKNFSELAMQLLCATQILWL